MRQHSVEQQSTHQHLARVGAVAVLGGAVTLFLATLAAGVAQAYTGFSALSMTVSMSARSVSLLWAVAMGVYLWRLAPRLALPPPHRSTTSE